MWYNFSPGMSKTNKENPQGAASHAAADEGCVNVHLRDSGTRQQAAKHLLCSPQSYLKPRNPHFITSPNHGT